MVGRADGSDTTDESGGYQRRFQAANGGGHWTALRYIGGGTGFDISRFPLPPDPQTGRKWIQYVRIDNPRQGGATPEIDALSDVAACGDWKHPFPPGDVTMDCRVDLADMAVISENWLVCTWECDE
jgi:hypothetical protein